MNRRRLETDPEAVALVEEAVHLLRQAPARAWAWYLGGTVPLVVALLFFWAHTTWFRPSDGEIAAAAFFLALLWAGMKVAQSVFCAHLLALRSAAPLPSYSLREVATLASVQLRLQPWALVASLAASLLSVPFGWVWAYGQIATVLGADGALHSNASLHARRWPLQNHYGLALICGIALCVWLNLATAFFAIPWLANRLLGIENIFGFSGWAFLNTTFLASVTALAWLAVDPLMKAFYTLWVFHGRARQTGEDIRVEILGRSPSLRRVAVAVFLLAIATGAGSSRLQAESAPAVTPAVAVNPVALNRSIDEVLEDPDFAWRLRPLPREEKAEPTSWLGRLLKPINDWVRSRLRGIGRWLRDILEWVQRHLSSQPSASSASPGVSPGMITGVLYLLVALLAGLLLWVGWLMLREWLRSGSEVVTARAVPVATPDLRDENVHAGQLPTDEWIALAQTEMARGEWRLALRALYLASLAGLAAEGLLSLARFKTNLDYEHEFRRRAPAKPDLVERFRQRRRVFEDVWYGERSADAQAVRAWFEELRQSRSMS